MTRTIKSFSVAYRLLTIAIIPVSLFLHSCGGCKRTFTQTREIGTNLAKEASTVTKEAASAVTEPAKDVAEEVKKTAEPVSSAIDPCVDNFT